MPIFNYFFLIFLKLVTIIQFGSNFFRLLRRLLLLVGPVADSRVPNRLDSIGMFANKTDRYCGPCWYFNKNVSVNITYIYYVLPVDGSIIRRISLEVTDWTTNKQMLNMFGFKWRRIGGTPSEMWIGFCDTIAQHTFSLVYRWKIMWARIEWFGSLH